MSFINPLPTIENQKIIVDMNELRHDSLFKSNEPVRIAITNPLAVLKLWEGKLNGVELVFGGTGYEIPLPITVREFWTKLYEAGCRGSGNVLNVSTVFSKGIFSITFSTGDRTILLYSHSVD